MRPAELLRTLHHKSYFKACQTIQVTQDNEALNSTSLHVALDELQGQFREIDQGLDSLDPDQLTRNDLNNIRYQKLR
jgi:hypothetical protein